MPTKRFSTRSSKPTPCLPPMSFSRWDIGGRKGFAIDRDGIAALEADFDIFRGVRGFFHQGHALIDEFGGFFGWILQHFAPSDEVCSRLASTLNGASPRLSLAIGIWFASANSNSLVRLVRSHRRHGAITLIAGSSAAAVIAESC